MVRVAALLLALAVFPARAADTSLCRPVPDIMARMRADGGTWTELTSDQWQFLRGVFVLDPATPAGLPFGDKAALAQVGDGKGGVVFFLDGERACTPMPVPSELIDILTRVGKGEIAHEGGDL